MSKIFFVIIYLFISLNVNANKLIDANDFTVDSKISLKNNQTILIIFGSSECSYCDTMKEEILHPMMLVQKKSNYLIRHVDVKDKTAQIVDFDGKKITMHDFSLKHKSRVTPTLIFLDNNGIESAQRIVGINTLDLLSYYIDSSIEIVSKKISQQPH